MNDRFALMNLTGAVMSLNRVVMRKSTAVMDAVPTKTCDPAVRRWGRERYSNTNWMG
jgi:hypothetical protein